MAFCNFLVSLSQYRLSLYTNVLVEEAIETTLNYIYKPTKLVDVPFDKERMRILLNLSIRDAPFRFQNKIYKQIDGVAMGNPLAPILADLWMRKIEEKLNRFSTNEPLVWLRYVDDVFCVFTIPREKILEFYTRINRWHPNLQFTVEFESNNSIAFLDVLVTQEQEKLTTSLYRKPTHTGLYLLWDSSQNRRYKLGLIKTLVICIYRICSSKEIVNRELSLLRKTLTNNGYPPHIIRRGIAEAQTLIRMRSDNKKKNESSNNKVIFFTIKYYGQESIVFASRIKKFCRQLLPNVRIQFAFKKHMSLKSIFLPKLKGTDENRKNKNLVYSIPCKDCDTVYIGETGRMKETRINEHRSKIRTLASDSKIVEHILKYKHNFDFSSTKTLALENDWRKRIIKESILTNRTLGKSINETKHTLQISR